MKHAGTVADEDSGLVICRAGVDRLPAVRDWGKRPLPSALRRVEAIQRLAGLRKDPPISINDLCSGETIQQGKPLQFAGRLVHRVERAGGEHVRHDGMTDDQEVEMMHMGRKY